MALQKQLPILAIGAVLSLFSTSCSRPPKRIGEYVWKSKATHSGNLWLEVAPDASDESIVKLIVVNRINKVRAINYPLMHYCFEVKPVSANAKALPYARIFDYGLIGDNLNSIKALGKLPFDIHFLREYDIGGMSDGFYVFDYEYFPFIDRKGEHREKVVSPEFSVKISDGRIDGVTVQPSINHS